MTALRNQIENLLYRYARGFDEQDLDLLVDCFTEDAELFSAAAVKGRPAIREALTASRQARADAGQKPRHITSNITIEPRAEDEVGVHSLFSLVITSRDGVGLDIAGTYTDTIVRQDGRWLIARRQVQRDAVE
jgi:ketosteroid isomerase-like protein